MSLKSMKKGAGVMRTQSHLAMVIGLSLIVTCITTEARADGGGRDRAQIEPTARHLADVGHLLRRGLPGRRRLRPSRTRKPSSNALADLMQPQRRRETRQQIAYWDAGAPAYRWIDLINARLLAGTRDDRVRRTASTRTWRWRCTTRRSRRGSRSTSTTGGASERRRGRRLPTALPVPNSPSYPSEHAATAQAAASVLAYFLPAEAAVLPGHGRGGRLVARAGRPPVPERLHGRARSRPQGRRAGHREGEGGRLRRRLDGHGTDRAVQVDRDQPGQRHGRRLDAPAAHLGEPVPAAAAAGVRLGRRCRPRSRDGQDLRPHVRDQLQGVLLAEPGRPQHLALPVRRQVACSRTGWTGIRRAPRASTRSSPRRIRRLHREPGREVHVLVPPAAPARPGHRAALRGAELPELPVEPLDVLGRPGPRSSRTCSRRGRTSSAPLGKEAGDSRIWAGIHYPMDNVAGVAARQVRGRGLHRLGRERRLARWSRSARSRCRSRVPSTRPPTAPS